MTLGPVTLSKPRLRGILHLWGFFAAIPAGVALGLAADPGKARVAGAIFAGSVVAMFGASALYHCVTWSPPKRRWMRQLDHLGIFTLIAGTYTPFGLLTLHGVWRITVLAIVWSGAVLAILLKIVWTNAPKWVTAVIGLGLGWVSVLVFPKLLHRAGVLTTTLVALGGLLYTLGAIVYALRKPNPRPTVFGYHELFHALTIGAVALQYAAVALVVA